MIAYTPEKTASYENLVKLAAVRAMQESGQRLFEGPVSVDIDLRMPIPASWSRRKRSEAICGRILPNKPDMDNAVKALFDALNGIAWIDDKQAVRLVVEKRYAQTPGVDVTISALALPVLPENREKNTP
jgi:Holliday junction resolvase RusA-like endonuclease